MSSESRSHKKEILLPVETWTDVLAFVSRLELSRGASLACWLFYEIAYPRMHETGAHFVPELFFDWLDEFTDWRTRAKARLRIQQPVEGNKQQYTLIPIAEHWPMPENIIGFSCIRISFLDAKVLRFLRIIQPILVDIHMIVWPRLLHSLEAINALLCDRIRTRVSRLTLFGQFHKICELYPTLVYRVPMLDINGSFMEEDIGALAQWLARPRSTHTRLANVLVLSFDTWTQLVEQLKQDFLHTTRSSQFLLVFPLSSFQFAHPFLLENATTREQLVLFTHQFESRKEPELVIRRWRIGHNGWRQLLANFEVENLEQKIMLDLRKVNEYDHSLINQH